MVYKSKKINKNRYFKSLQKRQSRKRMYGGQGVQGSTAEIPKEEVKEELPKEEVKEKLPKEEVKKELPTLVGNLEGIGNLAVSATTNAVADSIKSAAKSLGLDPNKSASESISDLGESATKIVDALNSPEGEKLQEKSRELLANGVEIIKPSIDKVIDIAEEKGPKLAKTLSKTVITAFNELPPVFLVNELSNLGTAAAQTGEAIAELTTTGAEAAKKLEAEKDKDMSLIDEAKSVFSNITQGINKGTSEGIKYLQDKVDKQGKAILEERIKNVQKIPYVQQMPNNNISYKKQGGGLLKKYQKERMMIGGRISQSQSEFLGGHVNSSQKLHQNGGKWNTKSHRSLKRRLTSRSYK